MTDDQKIDQLRREVEPITALWQFGDEQAYGSLIWRSGQPALVVTIEINEESRIGLAEPEHPIFLYTKPPIQATIVGIVPRYGKIVCKRCVRYNWRSLHSIAESRELFEVSFQPTEIWLGSDFNKNTKNVTSFSLKDRRLEGFFGHPGLETIESYSSNAKEIYERLKYPASVWIYRGPAAVNINLGKTGFSCDLKTQALSAFSATKGISINSAIVFDISNKQICSADDASDIIMKIEQLFSIISLEPFSFEYRTYYFDEIRPSSLVWRLGENRSTFEPPMHHQILVDSANLKNFALMLDRWFSASEAEQLSRWLFVRALRETTDGLARFVSVSQALEVLGREFGTINKMPKSKIRSAVEAIRTALSADFDKGFIDRVAGLIGSSNKASYRDVLSHMITAAATKHLPQVVPQIAGFAKNRFGDKECRRSHEQR